MFGALFYSSRGGGNVGINGIRNQRLENCEGEIDDENESRKLDTVVRLKNKNRCKCDTQPFEGSNDDYV